MMKTANTDLNGMKSLRKFFFKHSQGNKEGKRQASRLIMRINVI
jgi:hypothetical protein